MSVYLYRVQDRNGRGPFKPGFSRVWIQKDGPELKPGITEEFPDIVPKLQRAIAQGLHLGTAVRTTDDLAKVVH